MNKYDRKRNPPKRKAKNENKDLEKNQNQETWKCENCGERISTTRDKCWKCQKSQSKIRTEAKPLKPIDRIYYHSDLYDDAFGMDINDIIDAIGADSERSHFQQQARSDYFNFEGNLIYQNKNDAGTNQIINANSRYPGLILDPQSDQYSLDAVLERLGMLAVPCYVGFVWEREGRKEREAKIREGRRKKREEELAKSKVGKIKAEDVKQKKGKYRPSDLSRPDVDYERDEELIHLSDDEFSDYEDDRRKTQDKNGVEPVRETEDGRMVCPGCGQTFPSSWSNERVNEHVDECMLSPSNGGARGGYRRKDYYQEDRGGYNDEEGNGNGDYYSDEEDEGYDEDSRYDQYDY